MSFTESLALKVVSLLLALILWITILGFKREEMKKSVKFELLLPPGKVLVKRVPTEITFTIVGPRVLLKDVERRLQPIRSDLRGSRENTKILTITEDQLLDKLPSGVKVPVIQPTHIAIELEEVVERKKLVKANFIGELPDGYELKSISVTPEQIPVSGAKTLVENLEFLSTEPIPLQDVTQSEEREVTVEVDESQGFQVSRQRTVKVKINVRPTTKKSMK